MGTSVPGLDFSKLVPGAGEDKKDSSKQQKPGTTTNKDSGRRNSYRSLISPSSERAKNALADRLKRGVLSSMTKDEDDKEEEFEIKELTSDEYKDFMTQYDLGNKCVTMEKEG